MVSFWWASVDQATVVELLGVVIFSWVVGMVYRKGNSDKSMLGESVFVGGVSVRSILGVM